jgi:hypothetical protein
MESIYCIGIIQSGSLTGKPCRKFLGNLTPPFKDVICPRCGHKNHSEEQPTKESAPEMGQMLGTP